MLGLDKQFDKEAYKQELDHQVAQKSFMKNQQRHHSSREDKERLERIRNQPVKDEFAEDKAFRYRYRQELDSQNAQTKSLRNEERIRDEQEARNSIGLPLGKYNPNYKELLDYELRKQIAEKKAEKSRQSENKRRRQSPSRAD